MFQFIAAEAENLRFHLGISSSGYGERRYPPYAFGIQPTKRKGKGKVIQMPMAAAA